MKSINKYIGLLLFIFALVIGFINYDQYGIAWDEAAQREIGTVNYNYIFSDSKELMTHFGRYYGVAFELPLIIIEKTMGFTDIRDIYLARHLISHIFFLIGALCCFLLIDFLYKNKLLASTGFLLIILYPLLYAHSFFNTKDIPFAAMFLICFYLNAVAFSKPGIRNFIFLGIGVGILISMRIMGMLLFCCNLFFLAIDFFMIKEDKESRRKIIKLFLTFLAATAITLYITWPFLWKDPITNFIYSFHNMAKWPWQGLVLFNGRFIRSTEIPWNYIPVWFVITTPIYYLLAGFGGIILLFINFIRSPFPFLSNTKERNNLLYLICFFVPVVAVIILKSVLYDGWRQMYFIYPSFALLAIYGLNYILQFKFKRVIILITFLFFGYIGYFMIANNPFQHVYFNELMSTKPPEYIRTHFELDYWCTSYKQSLEYILENDKSPLINITPYSYNINILPFESRKRINFVEIQYAKYCITNYRWHPKDYSGLKQQKWHAFKVNNNTINEIFKLR